MKSNWHVIIHLTDVGRPCVPHLPHSLRHQHIRESVDFQVGMAFNTQHMVLHAKAKKFYHNYGINLFKQPAFLVEYNWQHSESCPIASHKTTVCSSKSASFLLSLLSLLLGHIKCPVQLFCICCLKYPWGKHYRTITRSCIYADTTSPSNAIKYLGHYSTERPFLSLYCS